LVHDYVVWQRECNTAIIDETASVGLIKRNGSAVTTGVPGEEMASCWEHSAGSDRQANANAAGTARTFDLPAGNIYWGGAVIVEFDELIARTTWTASAELTNYDGQWAGSW
jgi:hypothetical protein